MGSVIYLVLIALLALGAATTVRDTGLEHTLGSGLQIAEDGEHPSVVSV